VDLRSNLESSLRCQVVARWRPRAWSCDRHGGPQIASISPGRTLPRQHVTLSPIVLWAAQQPKKHNSINQRGAVPEMLSRINFVPVLLVTENEMFFQASVRGCGCETRSEGHHTLQHEGQRVLHTDSMQRLQHCSNIYGPAHTVPGCLPGRLRLKHGKNRLLLLHSLRRILWDTILGSVRLDVMGLNWQQVWGS
jgi:hypothetical protein